MSEQPTFYGAEAVIVVDGSADEIVARLVAAGWTLREEVTLEAGKRIRYLQPPEGSIGDQAT